MTHFARLLGLATTAAGACVLAGCAATPVAHYGKLAGRVWDPKLGVWSSPQLVAEGDAVPRGGGSYLTGRPYVIGGHTYYPSQNASGYVAIGTASWYGDAFHGRRTANGEIFDKRSISAAHPTLPLPSYVRVTNTGNGRSMIVRVNDRGPYHGGRVMDVSQRVADALAFRGAGTARVKVEYIGRAPLAGSDDEVLMASLRTDGAPARIDGSPDSAAMVADASTEPPPPEAPARPQPAPAAVRPSDADAVHDEQPAAAAEASVPLPPDRPFNLGDGDTPTRGPDRRRPRHLALAPAVVLPPQRGRVSPVVQQAAMGRHQAWLGGRAGDE